MEILSPQLMWIGGRCYRVNPTNEAGKNVTIGNQKPEIDELPVQEYIEKGSYKDK